MDSNRFDTLVKSLSSTDTRRALLRRLAPLPLAGLLATLLPDETEAGGRRKRRKTRNTRRSGDDKENRTGKRKGKRKGKNRGTPASEPAAPPPAGCTPTPCDGKACGADDGCGGRCQTGSCPHATCATCSAGQCVNVPGSCTTAGGASGTCDQGTCCVPTEGDCTGAGQCCGSRVCNIPYAVSRGGCDTCLSGRSKCDLDVGGCCGTLSCQPQTGISNAEAWCI